MPLKLHEVTTDAEFASISAVQDEAFSKPYNGIWVLLRGNSLEEYSARMLSWHKADPSSHWIYVTDEDTKEVIGATQWNVYETNPYTNGVPEFPIYWLPEGTMKEIASQIFPAFFGGRPSRMGMPHLLVNFCFVKSTHRHRGAGSLMMEWGIKKADKMGVQSFVESTEDGRGMYEANGFKTFGEFYMDAEVKDPSTEFTQLRSELHCPMHCYYMWRPKDGKFEGPEPSQS